jgi:hypothetical protein
VRNSKFVLHHTERTDEALGIAQEEGKVRGWTSNFALEENLVQSDTLPRIEQSLVGC